MSAQKGRLVVTLAGTSATTGGAVAAVANPEGASLLVTDAFLYVATASTGAANINAGIGTAAQDASDIIGTLAVNGVAGTGYSALAKTAKVALPAIWTSAKYLNVTGSATTAGLVAYLYVDYIRV